jgi:pimeloyl-ACP methyl ester carboxylesterase
MKLAQKLAIGYFKAKLNFFSRLSKRKAAEKALELFTTPMFSKVKNTPAVFEKAEKLHLLVNGFKLVGYRWNHPQPKRVMILHGFSSTVKKFDHFVMPLIKKGYEVLAFDAPAHGESSGRQVSVLDYTEMIKAVYEKFGPIHSFIAHSFGGLALSFFMEQQSYQENKKLVFIAPATETTTALSDFCSLLELDKEVEQEIWKLITEKSGLIPESFSIRRAAHHIKAEVLWIHDEDDAVTPWSDAVPIQNDAHPNFRFLLTKGLGHRRIYRDQAVKKQILEFL